MKPRRLAISAGVLVVAGLFGQFYAKPYLEEPHRSAVLVELRHPYLDVQFLGRDADGWIMVLLVDRGSSAEETREAMMDSFTMLVEPFVQAGDPFIVVLAGVKEEGEEPKLGWTYSIFLCNTEAALDNPGNPENVPCQSVGTGQLLAKWKKWEGRFR